MLLGLLAAEVDDIQEHRPIAPPDEPLVEADRLHLVDELNAVKMVERWVLPRPVGREDGGHVERPNACLGLGPRPERGEDLGRRLWKRFWTSRRQVVDFDPAAGPLRRLLRWSGLFRRATIGPRSSSLRGRGAGSCHRGRRPRRRGPASACLPARFWHQTSNATRRPSGDQTGRIAPRMAHQACSFVVVVKSRRGEGREPARLNIVEPDVAIDGDAAAPASPLVEPGAYRDRTAVGRPRRAWPLARPSCR